MSTPTLSLPEQVNTYSRNVTRIVQRIATSHDLLAAHVARAITRGDVFPVDTEDIPLLHEAVEADLIRIVTDGSGAAWIVEVEW